MNNVTICSLHIVMGGYHNFVNLSYVSNDNTHLTKRNEFSGFTYINANIHHYIT